MGGATNCARALPIAKDFLAENASLEGFSLRSLESFLRQTQNGKAKQITWTRKYTRKQHVDAALAKLAATTRIARCQRRCKEAKNITQSGDAQAITNKDPSKIAMGKKETSDSLRTGKSSKSKSRNKGKCVKAKRQDTPGSLRTQNKPISNPNAAHKCSENLRLFYT